MAAETRHPVRRGLYSWWAAELLAATVSISALVALVTLLKFADGQPQRIWPIGGTELTLNALVAVVSTVMRASLTTAVSGALNQSSWNWLSGKSAHEEDESKGKPLKDFEIFSEAAAGALNSIRLLLRTKGRYVASLGALVTVLVLGFDVFVQQVLSSHLQSYGQPSASNLSSINYLPRAEGMPQLEINPLPDQLTTELQAAVLGGMLNTTNAAQPGAICPTGNCTWTTTPTLAVCGTCDDARSRLNKTVDPTSGNITWTLNQPFSFLEQDESISANPSITFRNTSRDGEVLWALLSSVPYLSGSTSRPVIMQLVSLGLPNGPPNTDTWYQQARSDAGGLVAHNCTFELCLKAFSAETSHGQTKQKLEESGLNIMDSVDIETPDGVVNTWWSFNNIPSEYQTPNSSMVNISSWALQAFGTSLAGFFTTPNASYPTPDGVESSIGFAFHMDNTTQSMNPLSTFFWNASSEPAEIAGLAKGIADGLTAYVRTGDGTPPLERYAPAVKVLLPVVTVRWAWLTYPLSLVLSGLVFLGLTVLATRRHPILPWKGRRVPLLLAELDEPLRVRAQGGLARRTGLDDQVGAARVRVEFDGHDGLRFRHVPRSGSEKEENVSPTASTEWQTAVFPRA